MSKAKPKWYSVRLRILDYPTTYLWTMSGVGLIVMILILSLVLLYPQLRHPQFVGILAPLGGLWLAATGAALYKTRRRRSITGASVLTQPPSRTSSSLQFIITALFLVGLFLLWRYLESRGYTTTQIANSLAIIGGIILAFCLAVFFFVAVRKCGRR